MLRLQTEDHTRVCEPSTGLLELNRTCLGFKANTRLDAHALCMVVRGGGQ